MGSPACCDVWRPAAALQWDIYRHTRHLEDYRQLVALASEHGLAVDYRQRARDWLVERLDQPSQPPLGWAPRTADSLLEIHLFEGRLVEAQALCAERPVAPGLLHQLAQALKEPRGLPGLRGGRAALRRLALPGMWIGGRSQPTDTLASHGAGAW